MIHGNNNVFFWNSIGLPLTQSQHATKFKTMHRLLHCNLQNIGFLDDLFFLLKRKALPLGDWELIPNAIIWKRDVISCFNVLNN